MVSVEKAVIARYKIKDHEFEILVDGTLAMELKHGKNIPIRDILAAEEIFKDAKKGEKASENLIRTIFGTEDIEKIAKEIIEKGEIQLTTEYRKKITQEMKNKIINYISKNAIDARTKTPIPPQRVELAMEKAKARVDPFLPFEKQVEEIINKIRPFIPISFEKKKVVVVIPPKYAAKAYGILKHFNGKEEWLNDGSLRSTIILPVGLLPEVYDKIEKITHGEAEIKEV